MIIGPITLPVEATTPKAKWLLESGSYTTEFATGITQFGSDPIYVVDAVPPDDVLDLMLFDDADPTVYAMARLSYGNQLDAALGIYPIVPPVMMGSGPTPAGLTYGVASPFLARVVENGTCTDDTRVKSRTNEAIKALLDEIIPVGGMITFDVTSDGENLVLPAEMENAIEVEVREGNVRGQTDVAQGWYDIVNPFTYVHPAAAHDNPLVDLFMVADEDDPTILRRWYRYPGLSHGSIVRVTGAKRYIPITSDDDYMIIQNVWAIKLMIMAIERMENGALDQWKVMKDEAIGVLAAEVKKHQSDPTNVMKRKAAYDADLETYPVGTFGYTRALLAHMLPSGLMMGKSEIGRALDMAEMRLLSKGAWVGSLEQFEATVTDGCIALPRRVNSIVAAEMCGCGMDIRSIFFDYQQNGCWWSCEGVLLDQGEQLFGDKPRRVYHLLGARTEGETLRFVAKLRWIKKTPEEFLVIKNTEALRLMANAIIMEEAGKLQEAQALEVLAVNEVEKELREHLSGLKQHIQIDYEPADAYCYGGVM